MAGFENEPALAVLVDIENMARPGARNRGEFDIHLVLDRLAEKGRVVVKRAYADWSRYRDARRELMNAGLELIEMPSAREGAKNRADIKMAVDAMEIAYTRSHVTTFVIVSGDSDFTPLIGKLRELNKQVIGVGRDEASAAALLIANCDVFYFYDSMAKKATARIAEGVRPDALSLLRETLTARQREGDEHPQASAVKDSMRRRDPAFSESDIGFSTFSKFLEDAQSKGVVRLVTDAKSGTYLVELTDADPGATSGWPSVSDEPPVEISEGRRRRRRRRSSESSSTDTDDAATSTDDESSADAEAIDTVAEVFEWQVPDREPEMPPLDQPITYEDVLMAADAEPEPEATEPPTRGSRRRRKALSSVPEPDASDLEAVAEELAPEAKTLELVTDDAAAAEAPAAEEAPAEEEKKPARRSRVKRGTVLPPAAEEPAAEEAPADEKPAEEPAAEEPPAEEEKPKRRTATRRTTTTTRRKTAAERAAEAEAAAAAEAETPAEKPAAEEAPAEEEKPKRRRTVRRKATEETPPAEETPAEEG